MRRSDCWRDDALVTGGYSKMKTALGSAVAAATMLASCPPAMGQEAAKPAITAELVSRLCPVTGMPGLKLGATRQEQPTELLRGLRPLPASFAPFTEAELDTTAWSDRAAAITYRAASPDGDVNEQLLYDFDDTMQAAGWSGTVTDKTILPLSGFGGRTLEREVEGPEGKRVLLLEFSAGGALALRCGDPALLELDQRERDGTLEPGTFRPAAPPYDSSLRLPDAAACRSIAVQEATVDRDKFDEAAPEMVPFLAAAMQEADRSFFGKRLMTWLEWKLLGSTKVTDDGLVKIKEKAARADIDAEMGRMMQFLALGGELAKAREAGDKFASCDALRQLMAFEYQGHQAKWAYWSRVNTALEAEAKRLGIALD